MDELHAGHAGADDDQVPGNLLGWIAVTRGENALAVGLAPIRDPRPGTGGDEDGVGVETLRLAVGRHGNDGVRSVEGRRAPDEPHTLAHELIGDGRRQSVLDPDHTIAERFAVDVRLHHVETHALDAAGEAHGAAGGDHRLGGNAVPEMGGPTDDVTFDHGDRGAQPGRIGGGLVSGGSTTDDDEVQSHDTTMLGPAQCSPPPAVR